MDDSVGDRPANSVGNVVAVALYYGVAKSVGTLGIGRARRDETKPTHQGEKLR